MINAIRYNSGYILIMALWSIVGMLSTEASIVVILSTLILFFNKKKYFEALFGFFFLLVLSDNLQELWAFAKVVKPYYLILMSALVIYDHKELVKNNNILKQFIPYLAVASLCLLFAVQFDIAVQKTLSYALILFVIPNITIYEYHRIGRQFFANLIAFSVIIHFISISVLITFPEVGMSHGDRWQGMFGNPNGLGLFLIVFYLVYKAVIIEFEGIFSRRERIFYLMLTLVFLWMCGSRTALISITTFELALVGFRYSKFLTSLLLVSFFIYFDFIYDEILGFLSDLGLASDLRLSSIDDGSGRYVAWGFAWEYIKYDSFFLGKGLGYDEWVMRSNAIYLTKLGHEGGVHNTYLIIWLNTGLIGLISFFYGFLNLYIQAIRRKIYAFPSMLAVLISINFEPWLSASLNPYTVIFLILLTMMLFIDNEKEIV